MDDQDAKLGEPANAEILEPRVPEILEPADVVISGESFSGLDQNETRELEDDEVSSLAQKLVDDLGLSPEMRLATEMVEQDASAGNDELFKEAIANMAAFAEDPVKLWFVDIYGKKVEDVFPDGLTGSVGEVNMRPGKSEEDTRGDQGGWKLRLIKVPADHRTNIGELKIKEPALLQQIQGLLKAAWGYIHFALDYYDLPKQEMFINKIYPSPWGTLYLPWAEPGTPQLGVEMIQVPADNF
jgi:hypothetical protein